MGTAETQNSSCSLKPLSMKKKTPKISGPGDPREARSTRNAGSGRWKCIIKCFYIAQSINEDPRDRFIESGHLGKYSNCTRPLVSSSRLRTNIADDRSGEDVVI